MRLSTRVKEFVSSLMNFHNEELGARVQSPWTLAQETAPNIVNQSSCKESQDDQDKFRGFHVNHT